MILQEHRTSRERKRFATRRRRARYGTALLFSLAFFALSAWAAGSTQVPPISQESFQRLPAEVRDDAAAVYERLKQEAVDPQAAGRLGMLFHAQGDFSTAKALYNWARHQDPAAFEWTYYLAVLQSETGQGPDAVPMLRRALEIKPEYVPARLRLAGMLFDQGQWEEASSLYREVLEEHPDLAPAHYELGRTLWEMGRPGEAEKHHLQAVKLYPRYGAAHYALARIYRSRGELERARRQLRLYQDSKLRRPVIGDGLLEAVKSLEAGRARALRLIADGVQAGEGDALEEAIDKHEEALSLEPELLQGYINLVILYGRRGEIEKAEEVYRRALKGELESDGLHYNFATLLLLKTRRFREAADTLQKAIRINPLHAEAHNALGQAYENLGKIEEAAAAYRQAITLKPDSHLAHFNLGRILAALGDLQSSREELRQAASVEGPQKPRFQFALAAVLVRLGEFEEALPLAESALAGARRLGQEELALSIERDLQGLLAKMKR